MAIGSQYSNCFAAVGLRRSLLQGQVQSAMIRQAERTLCFGLLLFLGVGSGTLRASASETLLHQASAQGTAVAPIHASADVEAHPADRSPSDEGMRRLHQLMTIAESSGYTDTATSEQVELYLRELVSCWDHAKLTSIGKTNEGRTLWSLVLEPQVAVERPLTVLVIAGIHSGECDGKEGMLALVRDMAVGRIESQAWKSLRLIVVPNFNADGNTRRGLLHRPGQAGPSAGMGIRENAQGLDLNRDFMKLQSPEVRYLVAALNTYDVDVLIDMHTTNGSLHRYELTYDIPHNPATPDKVDRFLRRELMPRVTTAMHAEGFSTNYYGNFNHDYTRWETYGHQPRYSTEYMGVRGRIGILAESYSYAPYQTRVKASYAFAKTLFEHLSKDVAKIRQLIDKSASENMPGKSVPIGGVIGLAEKNVSIKGYQGSRRELPRPPFGPEAAASYEAHDYTLELWNKANATKSVILPTYYALDSQFVSSVRCLVAHGIDVKQLASPRTLTVQQLTTKKVNREPPYQGHALLAVTVDTKDVEVELPAGTFIIETAQPLGALAAYLLEPETDDGFVTWNFFDAAAVEGRIFPTLRVTETIAAEHLSPVTIPSLNEQ
jgi:dipeptidyl-peptidase 4